MLTETAAAEANGLSHVHEGDGLAVRALSNVSLTVAPGEVVAIMGPSGSGKSTLLFMLGGLDQPDEGTVAVAGVDWTTLTGADRARFRRRTCGFVVQGMALLPQATAAENIEVPMVLDGVAPEARASRVAAVLERVGLGDEFAKLPDQLSGGQQQRVALARALVVRPTLILADEPTGNLDSTTGQAITRLLVEAASADGTAVVLVTHDATVAAHADRIVGMHSGRLDADDRSIAHGRSF
jgi:putative ABC transport system ATP-binding protein